MTHPRRRTSMKISLAAGVATLALLTLGACGSDQEPSGQVAADPAGSGSGTPEVPDETTPAIDHPTGADDVVLRILTGGGFVPFEYSFTNQPTLLLTGDGRLILPAGNDVSFGNRLTAMRVVMADEDLVQQILAAADAHGLLAAAPDYEMDESQVVTDAPTTIVTITTGATYEHAAYALSFDGPGDKQDGPRAELAAFIDEAIALVPADQGTTYEPEQVRLFASEVGGDLQGSTTVLDWPASDIDLATVQQCTVVDAGNLPDVLGDADGQTFFRQDDLVYTVAGADVLPGDEPCADAS